VHFASILLITYTRTVELIIRISFQDIVSISVRRGGIDVCQPYNQWLSTISQSPNVISMSLVPITSLLNSVPGNGFLSHAVNLYLRCE
jgi:hypothetical protein